MALVDEDAEANFQPKYLDLATGTAESAFGESSVRSEWPFPVDSIGHTMASYQRYGGSPAYFHHGLDIRGDAGTPILASAGGKVVNIENYHGGSYLYWEIAILDDRGFLWQYHHVDHLTIPQEVKDAFAAGERVEAGQFLGGIVEWPVDTFGETYHHVHLNVLGAGGVYQNPFDFLKRLPDNQAPTIQELGLLNPQKQPIQGNEVTGEYSIYLKARDLILHDQFFVPPHSIQYQIDDQAPVTFWKFHELPGKASRFEYVHDFYVPRKTCGNYSCRSSMVDLGFQVEGTCPFPKTPGSHLIKVVVRDYLGNQAEAQMQWTVE